MRIQKLNVGVESITRWQVRDEQHLPKEGRITPKFLPKHRELDEILRRPSLDERLPRLLQPAVIDPDLLEPGILAQARQAASNAFASAAHNQQGDKRNTLEKAAQILENEVELDNEVRTALAALLKG